MTKFHINAKGVPAPCKAKKNCPFGGASGQDNHYDTIEEAQAAADKQNEEKHGILAGVQIKPAITKDKVKEVIGKETKVQLKSGETISGFFQRNSTNTEENQVILTIPAATSSSRFSIEGEEKVLDLDDIESVTPLTEHSYYSQERSEELRKQGIPNVSFRYTEDQLNDMKDKFIHIDYYKEDEGKETKEIYGKVIDVYPDGNNSGLIIENSDDGSVKHIKTYRLDNLSTTDYNEREFKQYMKKSQLEEELRDTVFADEPTDPHEPENDEFEDPYEYLDNYFEAVIDKEKGKDVDLDKLKDFDFTEYIEEEDYHYHGHPNDPNPRYQRTDAGEDAYYDDISKAEDNMEFVDMRIKAIDETVEKIKSIDWTPYYDTQEEGVIDTLTTLSQSGIATDY